ncbi:hypothetical protein AARONPHADGERS_103 [Bacillus phage AaronPhadgers]|uniref:hypothetical protein n=1 Tax=Bacillus phage Zuko TaxID=1805956 RepID=UPI0007A7784C|nr:hypothetical protein BI001_gp278 [Bacillus phage Zuko]AMW62385.1 hypothetical protein ZUKO_100 [Bacillus phage Zuko]ASR79032.1 hypothetical protein AARONPHADGERS_103 [Bacillus phage AaronPhadgers]AXF41973.1 hypothetical protein [Bacillus phage Saddex]
MTEFNLGSLVDNMMNFKDETIKEQIEKIVELEYENHDLKNKKKNLEDDVKFIYKVCGGWIGLCYEWSRDAEKDRENYYYTDEEIDAKIEKYMARAQALREVRELIERTRENRDF